MFLTIFFETFMFHLRKTRQTTWHWAGGWAIGLGGVSFPLAQPGSPFHPSIWLVGRSAGWSQRKATKQCIPRESGGLVLTWDLLAPELIAIVWLQRSQQLPQSGKLWLWRLCLFAKPHGRRCQFGLCFPFLTSGNMVVNNKRDYGWACFQTA